MLDRAAGVDGAALGEGGAVSVIEIVRKSGRCVGKVGMGDYAVAAQAMMMLAETERECMVRL